ncbi:MAG TPA: RNA polymerase factor sigma-54, partial [Candidatus Angelobacter sp.]
GSEDELLGTTPERSCADAATHEVAGGIAINLPIAVEGDAGPLSATLAPVGYSSEFAARIDVSASAEVGLPAKESAPPAIHLPPQESESELIHIENSRNGPEAAAGRGLNRAALREAIELVRQMDPIGVAARDLRECLLAQLHYHQQLHQERKNGSDPEAGQLLADSLAIVNEHLHALQNKRYKEIAKAIERPVEEVMKAVDLIRTLDPKPGLRYNKIEPTLIEPDVAFIKQGDEYLVLLNEDDIPQLRLSPTYKRLLQRDAAERDVRNYVKERYKSAIQLIKNIEQRKQTILKVCYAIIGRQREFLDRGIDHLKPMMIKEVAEEIGVHPSTVSRAVANKYAHTAQGVFELRYFFSESVNGPEGGSTSLLILKRRVKKLIEEEDPARPLTDEQITRILQSQGIQVTRRTVAKYREDMRIPSTHQRRVKN